MATTQAITARLDERAKALEEWEQQHGLVLQQLDDGQQWLVFAALRVGTALGALPALMRLLAYLLAHCGMGLSGPVIAALTGVSDRAIRTTKALTPHELLLSVRTPPRGRGKPKLGPEHAGAVAKFLVEHPDVQVSGILSFVREELHVELDRKTLRVYIARYGLGCLRGDMLVDAPLFSEARTSAAHFS